MTPSSGMRLVRQARATAPYLAVCVVLGVLAVTVSLLLIGLTGFGKMRSQAEGA